MGQTEPSRPCVFCEIVADRAPAKVLGRTRDSLIFEPLGPVTPGHALIVPREHVADAGEDAEITARTMADAARWAARIGQAFNLITSAGGEATQTVFHLHVHYVPRVAGVGLALPWTAQHAAMSR